MPPSASASRRRSRTGQGARDPRRRSDHEHEPGSVGRASDHRRRGLMRTARSAGRRARSSRRRSRLSLKLPDGTRSRTCSRTTRISGGGPLATVQEPGLSVAPSFEVAYAMSASDGAVRKATSSKIRAAFSVKTEDDAIAQMVSHDAATRGRADARRDGSVPPTIGHRPPLPQRRYPRRDPGPLTSLTLSPAPGERRHRRHRARGVSR